MSSELFGTEGGISAWLLTLVASMVAEPAGSPNLRGTVLAEEITKAASEAGGEVFKKPQAIAKKMQELLMALGAGLASIVVAKMCAKRSRITNAASRSEGENTGKQEDEEQE